MRMSIGWKMNTHTKLTTLMTTGGSMVNRPQHTATKKELYAEENNHVPS